MSELFKQLSYTIISNPKGQSSFSYPFSLLVLNRVNKFQMHSIFKNFSNYGFEEIISIQTPNSFYDSDSVNFNSLKTILINEDCELTIGQKINLGIQESVGEFVFVIWSDYELMPISRLVIDNIIEQKNLCTTLSLKNNRQELVPSVVIPILNKNEIKTIAVQPSKNNLKTIYPFDYAGIYHREKFLQVGGYDSEIESTYWQKMDFGFRSYLYNEVIQNNFALKIKILINNIDIENVNIDDDYKKFYLKNLTIKYEFDHGKVPVSGLLDYLKLSKKDLFKAFLEYMNQRKTVNNNSFRYKTDYKSILKNW